MDLDFSHETDILNEGSPQNLHFKTVRSFL